MLPSRIQCRILFGGVMIAVLHCALSASTCPDTVPEDCVLNKGSESWDSNVPFLTAVGCRKQINVTFGSLLDDQQSPHVELYTATSVKKNSRVLDATQTACCVEAPLDREKTCVFDRSEESQPFDLFDCINLNTVKTPGYTTAMVTFVAPYNSDMTNDGMLTFCLAASHGEDQLRSHGYCINIQVQRCSTCIKEGQGLSNIAKEWGTHWTQIYSSNEDIVGTPDMLEEGRLLRLGPLYQLREGDTLMSVALKFGVSVNQLFYWNKYLRPLEDAVSENNNTMSREVAVGHQLCILPKTCYNSFVDQQPVFNQIEVGLKPSKGGAWADPKQV